MRDHKSLIAWQRANTVALAVLQVSKSHRQPWASAVLSQLRRASLSVQLNIAEGHAYRSPARFRYHLLVAYGSVVETIELLELAIQADVLSRDIADPMLLAAVEARGMLLGLMKKLNRRRVTPEP